MPTRLFSDVETAQLSSWPSEVARSDLVACFTLGIEDLRWVRSHRGAALRLGLAVQLCALRYLGFIPDDLAATPVEVSERVAQRIGVAPSALRRYAGEVGPRVRREHVASVIERAGWRPCGRGEWKDLGGWLLARALEHDTPSVLFHQALGHLRTEHVVRPGLDRLMRAVASARMTAWEEIDWRLRPVLTPERRAVLDGLVATDPARGVAPLVWLHDGATSASAEAIKAEIAKLTYLREIGADEVDVSCIPPERIRQLAALARRSTPKALRQMVPERRYPILLAGLGHGYGEIIDELVRMFDQALAATDKRARTVLRDQQLASAEANLGRLVLLDEILDVVLDDGLDDPMVGARLRGLGRERLATAVRSDEERLLAENGRLQLLDARFNHVRSFAPHVLGALRFAASVAPSEILDAVRLLQTMNAEGRRQVPAGAPISFAPVRWQPSLAEAKTAGEESTFKHYWELAVLFALQGALRSGEIWVEGSRRYADPASYLIPPVEWPAKRAEVLDLTGTPPRFEDRLEAIDEDMGRYLDDLEALLADGKGPIRLGDDGELHLSPLTAEVVAPDVLADKGRVLGRLPMVPLAEILIDVDRDTGFTRALTDAVGSPRIPEVDHRRNLYGALLAEACNFGTTRMAELTAIPVDTLDWYVHTYLRDEPALRAANALVVNHHHRHPLASAWGGGTLSSSDGLRLPMRGKSLTARALSRYFVDEGVTAYLWVSDQHSTYGTQIIVPTERDGLFTLDEILGNTTELPIEEHATDTHGQLLVTFALYDLVGLRLSPRIANLTERQLWRPHPPGRYGQWPRAGPLLGHHAQIDLIAEHWDEFLRVAGSLKLGYVSASLLVAKLQAGARQHPLAKALLEHGKLLRTVHALRWFTDEAFRRRIGRQLNKGEALNDLRRFLAFAHSGEERYRHHGDQTAQALCLTLVTNACILSTTGYIQDAVDAERADGREVSDQAIAHISPGHFEAINPYGTHPIDVAAIFERNGRRPLRSTNRR